MADAALRSDATLAEWLAAHARAVSARRLTLDVIGGTVVAVAAALGRPLGSPVLLAVALCVVRFGAWAAVVSGT